MGDSAFRSYLLWLAGGPAPLLAVEPTAAGRSPRPGGRCWTGPPTRSP